MDILERIYHITTKSDLDTFKLCLNPVSYFSAIQTVFPAKLPCEYSKFSELESFL